MSEEARSQSRLSALPHRLLSSRPRVSPSTVRSPRSLSLAWLVLISHSPPFLLADLFKVTDAMAKARYDAYGNRLEAASSQLAPMSAYTPGQNPGVVVAGGGRGRGFGGRDITCHKVRLRCCLLPSAMLTGSTVRSKGSSRARLPEPVCTRCVLALHLCR